MTLNTTNINSLWASLLIEELNRHGVTQFVISPGSRSTPLVVAVAEHPDAQTVIHYDERGAAFFALGYARATQRPAALICTSGTAVANYLPAVVEASVDCVPMILLTADRPPELRDTGANQTITQPGIFATYPRWQYDIPCPSADQPADFLLKIVDQAVGHAIGAPAGPVHLNCMYREPLAPVKTSEDLSGYFAGIESWSESRTPYVARVQMSSGIPEKDFGRVKDVVSSARRGLLIAGGLKSESERRAVAALAQQLNWPLIADIGSGLRGGEIRSRIDYYDLILSSSRFIDEHRPDSVLQIGSRLASKRLLAFLEKTAPNRYVQVLDHPFRHDPIQRVTDRMQDDIELGCGQLLKAIPAQQTTEWFNDWKKASQTVDAYLERSFASATCMTEPLVAYLLSGELAEGSALWAASSMPIRDLDQFYDPRGRWIPVGCNRGASGIDGTVASAAGYSLGTQKHVTLLIGDLAMLHDLNSLALLKDDRIRMTVVVLNNNGGGIFGHLPIAGFDQMFEKYFVTPHGLNFAHAAKMFSLAYRHPTNAGQFVDQYRAVIRQPHSTLIELTIDRSVNQQFHFRIVTDIAARLDGE